MNIAGTICNIARQNVGRNCYRKFGFTSTTYEASQSSQPQVKEEKFDFEDLKVLERVERRKAPIEPFMKNVFVSNFDRDLLAFPEILNKEEYENLDQRCQKLEKAFLDPEKNENDRRNVLKQARLFAAPVKLTDGGLAMNVTERLRYLETISSDAKLTKEVSDHWVALEAVQKGLDTAQYQQVISDLTDGNNTITLCTKETISTRIAQADFRTKAELDGQGIWRINGQKECENVNGFLLVLCSIEASRLKAYLVHPNSSGISAKDGLVSFSDTPGTPLNVLSPTALSQILGLSRLDTAVICYSSLRRAIGHCRSYVRNRFVSGKPLSEVSTIQSRVGAALLTAYAAESAAYFTAGLLDGYQQPDAELEMAMCRNFITHHALRSLLSLETLPGLTRSDRFHTHFDVVRKLTSADESDDNVNMFIALNGLHHAGKMMSQEVKQMRNPLFNPSFIMKKVWSNRDQEKDDPKLTLHLAEHLHPSLRPAAELLEYSVLRLRFASETLMARHGMKVNTAFTELERLAQASTEVLAMTAALARASRAYCIGLRNGEVDMKLGACFVEKSMPRVKRLILEIDTGEYLNQDHLQIHFGKKTLDNQEYPVEKPIDRTFW